MSELPEPSHDHQSDEPPIMMDLFSGEHAPLAKAFLWCGWRVITLIDITVGEKFDVTRPAVQRAILRP